MPTSNIDHAALPIKILVGLFLFKKANLNFLYPKELNSAHYSHENEDLKKALKFGIIPPHSKINLLELFLKTA